MDGLITFNGLVTKANQTSDENHELENLQTMQVLQQLRRRLISPDYRDSLETKIAILADMYYIGTLELLKRRLL